MTPQPNLFGGPDTADPVSIQSAFSEFHRLNPNVYFRFVDMARLLKKKGHRKIGIAMLFEVLRYSHMSTTGPSSEFKLNNNFRSRYARLIMLKEGDLDGIFDIRDLRAD